MLIAMDAGSCDRALMPSLPLVINERGMSIDVPPFPGHCSPLTHLGLRIPLVLYVFVSGSSLLI